MAMNGEHLTAKTRELLDRPIEERIAYIQVDSWIPYSQANRILEQLEALLRHPKCDRMPNLAITAQTNNGKTRLMKHFLSLHQASQTTSGTIAAPVFYLQCPGFPDESRLYSAILLKLCKRFRPNAPAQEKLGLVLDALSKIEIRILALDEVNFTEVGTAAKQKRFLNALRYLANELRISIVCLGTEEMMRVIRSVPSVENRFPPMVLPQWQSDHEFRKLLASFEKIIPLKHPSGLPRSSRMTTKLLARSEGTIGELKMLLAAAATDAMRNGTERINEEIIDRCNYTAPSARKQRPVPAW
jgi:TniB protein